MATRRPVNAHEKHQKSTKKSNNKVMNTLKQIICCCYFHLTHSLEISRLEVPISRVFFLGGGRGGGFFFKNLQIYVRWGLEGLSSLPKSARQNVLCRSNIFKMLDNVTALLTPSQTALELYQPWIVFCMGPAALDPFWQALCFDILPVRRCLLRGSLSTINLLLRKASIHRVLEARPLANKIVAKEGLHHMEYFKSRTYFTGQAARKKT